ncbi:penicillin-binding protein activator [Enterobacter hormaechei]|uniref:penicillin-binding protein activator n=1 Tax=Enterobacter hormaechei TaxID=158836 RepID=UPI0013EF9AD5|nr:penicillin-binding protein activator [Enterobacter hormaechei]KAF6706031.1 penicillin-binding protein activator [Enterobacter hormaechei]KAF6712816.1 penicillin-binding protein activator [Enterobacter hormaechei]
MRLSDFYDARVIYGIPLVAASLFFTGCAVRPADQSAALLESPVQTDSAQALQRMLQSKDSNKTSWQLLAIRALLREGKNQQATDLFSQLLPKLDDAQQQERSLLAVELKLAQNDFTAAQTLLAKINPADLKGTQAARYWQCMVTTQQGKPSPALLRALMAQAPLLSTMQEKQRNSDATWQALTAMSQTQVDAIKPAAGENILRGWLALRRVWSDNRDTPDRLKAGVSAWQTRWTQHPATRMLPASLVNDMNFRPASVRKIALMLPLSGPAARFGRAIQQGFEAEKKAASSASGQPSELMLYDTATRPVAKLLAQAQQDGATLVVGPLLKNHVEELLSSNTTQNVLALNLPEHPVRRDNVCYFALSPEDEARSAARHIHKQGKHFPLLLLPGSEISERVARAFADEWRKQNDGVVLAQRFGSLVKLKAGVKSGITLTGSPVAASLDDNGSFRRGRVDAVYIIATPEEMGYLKPMIAERNGSQSDAMLYASSRSISGTAGPDYRLDMERLQFSDIPLLANGNPGLKQLALNATGNDYFLARLFAMGTDAWTLANHYAQLRQTKGVTLKGNTGDLSSSPECAINRELPWFRYLSGRAVSL